jgi:hypothetical protein
MPTRAELKTMICRLLEDIQEFHHRINNLNYWESLWLNKCRSITSPLLADLETAQFDLQTAVDSAGRENFWTQRGHPDPQLVLLMECADLIAHFNGGKRPGATKGEGDLVKFTRAVYRYATAKDKINFDRQVDAMRRVLKESAFLRDSQKKTSL